MFNRASLALEGTIKETKKTKACTDMGIYVQQKNAQLKPLYIQRDSRWGWGGGNPNTKNGMFSS